MYDQIVDVGWRLPSSSGRGGRRTGFQMRRRKWTTKYECIRHTHFAYSNSQVEPFGRSDTLGPNFSATQIIRKGVFVRIMLYYSCLNFKIRRYSWDRVDSEHYLWIYVVRCTSELRCSELWSCVVCSSTQFIFSPQWCSYCFIVVSLWQTSEVRILII